MGAVWTGKSLQPFSVTEDETLQDVITYASSVSNNLTLPSEDTNKQNVLREVARMKQAIRKDIAANCLYFSSTTNIWSFAERKSFMILTIHYLTENFFMRSFILEVQPIKTTCTSEMIKSKMDSCFSSWDLDVTRLSMMLRESSNHMMKALTIGV